MSAGGGGTVAAGEALAAATGGATLAPIDGLMPGGGGTTGTVPGGVAAKPGAVLSGAVAGDMVTGAVAAGMVVAGADAEIAGDVPAAGGGVVCANKFRATGRATREVIRNFFIC